jgi:hypothetical protein
MRYFIAITLLALAIVAAGCDLEDRVPAEMVSMDQSHPLGQEKSLDARIQFDIGSLEVTGDRKAQAYSLDLEYDKTSYTPDVRYDPGQEGRFSFRLESNHRGGLRPTRQGNRLRLGLTDSVPVKLNIDTGVGDARLNLSGLKIEQLELKAGVGGSRLAAYEPNPIECSSIRIKNGVGSMNAVGLANLNFHDMEFEGGVGGADLDFTGDWKQSADIAIQVGVGGVTMRMPREVGVRVEAEKHFLSGLHLEGFEKRDSYYYSESYDRAKVRVSVRVATGVGGFRLVWV